MARGIKTGGRTKGTPNKFNADLRDMIQGALNDVGGRDYLAAQARDNPAAFLTLVGKTLPKEIVGSGGGDLIPKEIVLRFA